MNQETFERPIVTVDAVVFALRDGQLNVLLARRRADSPFAPGQWALPGGFIHINEDKTDEDAVRRVLAEKAGAKARHLEQLRTFASASRDSRGWSVSISYLALVDTLVEDEDQARYFPVDSLPRLPFDHAKIVQEALVRVRNKATYSSLPTFFLPKAFTLPQMQEVYEIVLGQSLNTPAFRRKVADQGLVEECDAPKGTREGGRGRPAQFYRLAQGKLQNLGRSVMTPDERRGGARS